MSGGIIELEIEMDLLDRGGRGESGGRRGEIA